MKIIDPKAKCKSCPWYYDSRTLMEGKGLCKNPEYYVKAPPTNMFARHGWQIVEEDEFCEEHPEFQIIDASDDPQARRAIDDALGGSL